jgi:cytochrome P450
MAQSAVCVDDLDLPEVDLSGDAYLSDPAGVLQRYRQVSWLIRTPAAFAIQVLSHEVAAQMIRDPRLNGPGPDMYRSMGFSPLMMKYATEGMLPLIPEPPHHRIRRVLTRGFVARRVEQQRDMMRSVTNDLIGRFPAPDECELLAHFSHHYPIIVVCRLMGIPDADISRFDRWTTDLGLLGRVPITPWVPRIDAALTGLYGYFRELVPQRRRSPGEDFVSAVIQAQTDSESLTEDEMFGALVNLLFAGHDTTRFQFGWLIYMLLTWRDQWERLVADPALAPGAVEESMRLTPSLRIVLRRADEDVEYRGVIFPAGTLIGINTLATNTDPEVFDSPETFDLTRSNASRQLIFGGGARLCLGHALARAEMTEALQIFAARFPDMELGGDVEFTPSPMLLGPERLPLRLRKLPLGAGGHGGHSSRCAIRPAADLSHGVGAAPHGLSRPAFGDHAGAARRAGRAR